MVFLLWVRGLIGASQTGDHQNHSAPLGPLGTAWPTCRFCCPRCQKAVRDATLSHLGPQKTPARRPTIFTGRSAVSASRVAKPDCRTTIFTGRLHRLLFYYFTISFPFGSRQRFSASRVAKTDCRTTIFTGRPHRLLFYYFTISFPFGSMQRFLHLGSRNLNVEPPFSPVGRTLPESFLHLGQPILHVGSRFCMSAKHIPNS